MEEETTSAGGTGCPISDEKPAQAKFWRLGRASAWTVEIRSGRRQRRDTVVFGKYYNTVKVGDENCILNESEISGVRS